MGWFDEDDDEDEQAVETAKIREKDVVTTSGDQEEEDDDPLDAYMKTLVSGGGGGGAAPPAPEDELHSSPSQRPHHRMDLEMEDESTGHWELPEDERGGCEEKKRISVVPSVNPGIGMVFHKANESPAIHSSEKETASYWSSQDTPEGRSWRKSHGIMSSKSVDPLYHWSELEDSMGHDNASSTSLVQHLISKIPQPTPVQQQTIPIVLKGHNAIITASTGQGKTLSYLIPALIRHRRGLTVVLVPTRELALQVEQAARPLLTCIGGTCKSVIGGKESNYDVVKALKRQNFTVIVASPGRLVDVTKKVLLDPSLVVLDECDKLLQMGFEEPVRQLLCARFASQTSSSSRQMLLLSATLGNRVQQVAREWLGPHSVRIAVGKTGQASQFVTQHVLVLADDAARLEFCVQMVPTFRDVGRTLIFVATRAACESLAETIEQRAQVKVATLHGDKHQWDRTAALKSFVQGQVSVLVATDLASRGLDIPQVATVLCVHPAKNLDSHTHRIGRAGRLDKNQQQQGTAYTLLTPDDFNFARVLKAAWEREGRPVGLDLAQLASASNKQSLGNHWESSSAPSTTPQTDSSAEPPSKKSRWGAQANA